MSDSDIVTPCPCTSSTIRSSMTRSRRSGTSRRRRSFSGGWPSASACCWRRRPPATCRARRRPVETPLGPAPGRRVHGGVVVVPVLRAGLGMLDAVLELIPSARVGHIGLQRDEMTAVASQYYSKLPADLTGCFVLMIDPMLATGGSAVAALDLLRRAGARDVRMICIVSAPEGIALVERHHPDVAHLHAGRGPGPERAQVHRPGPWRFRRPALRNVLDAADITEHARKADAMRRATKPASSHRRAVADRPDLHRAQQDHRPRLPARRDHGPPDVRRSDLPAADGRDSVAGSRPADGGDAGVVHRPRRHSARRRWRRVTPPRPARRSARAWPRACWASGSTTAATSRAACSFSIPDSRWCGSGGVLSQAAEQIVQRCVDAKEIPPGLRPPVPHAATRAPPGCSRWRSSSRPRPSTSR